MRTDYKKIFYVGIAYDAFPENRKKLKKEGLPIKKLGRELPYLLGEERIAVKKLQIFYALLPEYSGKAWLNGRPKSWKQEEACGLLQETGEKAAGRLGCGEQVLAGYLGGDTEKIPLELLAVSLYRRKPFDRVGILLPVEGGDDCTQQAIELLCPYLPRIRQVVLGGVESGASEALEDYLYGEFGIVMTRTGRLLPDMPWLDLREEQDQGAVLEHKGKVSLINRRESLKFLDTSVKNGYNTES